MCAGLIFHQIIVGADAAFDAAVGVWTEQMFLGFL
jgi:hypothetical protein